jgi:hypothetical protein
MRDDQGIGGCARAALATLNLDPLLMKERKLEA